MQDARPLLPSGLYDSLYGLVGENAERNTVAQEWEIPDPKNLKFPYLAHIKALSGTWRTLRHLADWMEVGTSPSRWTNEYKKNSKERARRCEKTKVAFLEYTDGGAAPQVVEIEDPTTLKEVLQSLKTSQGTSTATSTSSSKPLRLFVVEDLSQQVIEQLGARFDVDPLFFREQIEDYVWHNLRAVTAMPAPLLADMKNRSWFRVRNFRLRHHETQANFLAAQTEATTWNVTRRPDDDMNHWRWAGEDDAIVSMLRTRTSIWVGPDPQALDETVAIILLDPTVKDGKPLWYDRANWLPVPSMTSTSPPPHLKPSLSWYSDILTLTRLFPWFEAPSLSPIPTPSHISPHVIAKPALYTICAEWLVVADYVKGRLSQIERELELPLIFRRRGDAIDASLARLHTWRRAVPTFIDMVQETLDSGLPAASRLTTPLQRSNTGGFDRSPDPVAGYTDIAPDFERVLAIFTELRDRVDRLSGVVASEISIEDSRRANAEAHNMARVTWLATVFIPATFVSGLYSMNEDVAGLRQTYWIYFVTAVPVTLGIMAVAWVVGGGSLVPWRVSKEEGGWRKENKGKGGKGKGRKGKGKRE